MLRLPRSNAENYKWKLIKNRWNPKFGLRDFENGLLTSRGSVNFSKKYIFSIKAKHWEKWAIARLSGQTLKITGF